MTTEIDLTGDDELDEDIEKEVEELIEAMEEGECDCPACKRADELFGDDDFAEYQQELLNDAEKRERLKRRAMLYYWPRGTGKSRSPYSLDEEYEVKLADAVEDAEIDVEAIVDELESE